MEWPQKYFEIMYKIIRQQNKELLKTISIHENISYNELEKEYLPSKKYLKEFMNHYQN